MPNFKNTPNKCITSTGGEQYWISRSCAVAVVIIAINLQDRETYVLLNQRGPGTMDFQGLWNMPCGYIDWNETSGEAAAREVWEETGLDVNSIKFTQSYLGQPWYVQSDPSANRQNITLRHGGVFSTDKLPELTAEHSEPDEISDVRWVPVSEVLDGKYECAFGHDTALKKFLAKL